jgi:cytochrome c oxidase subunit 2
MSSSRTNYVKHGYVKRVLVALGTLVLAGCQGVQSALEPAGHEAVRIASLFWWMTGGAVVIWLAVIALALYAVRAQPERFNRRRARLFIVGGGAVVPTIVLTALLVYGLAMLPELITPAPPGSLKIFVSGEQWWWRVRYQIPGLPEGQTVELANEVRLPVNQPVQFQLDSPDVIHSFWIPSLAGKMDMIPGRVTHLAFKPTRTGVFRGACAEYCGASHALMSFSVEVLEQAEFDAWLARQTLPAQVADGGRGQELFLATGCNACHTVRGTPANGVIGPDLTHVGSRMSLAAAILPNDPAAFRSWLAQPERHKPGVLMPAFGMLPAAELTALAAYLEELK